MSQNIQTVTPSIRAIQIRRGLAIQSHRQHSLKTIRRGRDEMTTMMEERVVTPRDPEADARVYLVVQRKPLSEKPWLWRWLARWVYFRIGWASDYGVEYQGVFADESAARHAASGPGMSYTELPLNGCLPDETCQGGTHDFPLSEASHVYRDRQLPHVSFPQSDVERLRDKIRSTDVVVERYRAKTV